MIPQVLATNRLWLGLLFTNDDDHEVTNRLCYDLMNACEYDCI